jgi:hypothetical protein
MLTFFTTAKPFRGHDGIIQRNALNSWKLLHPNVEVILFGDDEGAAEVCSELELVHYPKVECHESGPKPRLDFIFRIANQIARHRYLCYSNCDIVLMNDFWKAFETVRSWRERFLLVSQRWDRDVTIPIDFTQCGWARHLRESTLARGIQRDEYWIDLFLFVKGLYREMPPLIVGHCFWDNWMIWKALQDGVPVVDASQFVLAVHQNHGYSPQSGRVKGASTDELSRFNLNSIGGIGKTRVTRDATHNLTRHGALVVNMRRYTYPVLERVRRSREFLVYRIWLPVWHLFLHVTRPLRTVLRLRSKAMREQSRG